MSSSPEGNVPQFVTAEGAPVQTISLAEYNHEGRHALSLGRLQNETIYQANAVSRRFAKFGRAITFDVLIRRPQLRGKSEVNGFTFSMLDDDYRPVETYYPRMLSIDRWLISPPHKPITLHLAGSTEEFNQLNLGYMLEQGDTTLQDVIHSTLENPQKSYDQLKKAIEQSRRDPLFPPFSD